MVIDRSVTARVRDLSTEIAELRAELATLRAALAGEVRTRRLVVVDEHGEERIVARAGADTTMLSLSSPPLSDLELGDSVDRHATLELWAERVDPASTAAGEITATAKVACSTGDDSFTVLGHTQVIAADGRSIDEFGELELDQQRWRRRLDGEMDQVEHSTIRVPAAPAASERRRTLD